MFCIVIVEIFIGWYECFYIEFIVTLFDLRSLHSAYDVCWVYVLLVRSVGTFINVKAGSLSGCNK